MRRNSFMAGAVLLLGGCLSTPERVFDASNSLPVAEIPEFMAYVETWEAFAGIDGSPRELIDDGARGTLIDDILVVQENTDYYALAVIGRRPLMCVMYADDKTGAVATNHGVSVTIDKPAGQSVDQAPVPFEAEGPPAALEAFIRDQFANQKMACLAPPRTVD